jgi:hypothetical protein
MLRRSPAFGLFLETLKEAGATRVVYDASVDAFSAEKRPVLRLEGHMILPRALSAHPRFPCIEATLKTF